jgi:hypothetical protein
MVCTWGELGWEEELLTMALVGTLEDIMVVVITVVTIVVVLMAGIAEEEGTEEDVDDNLQSFFARLVNLIFFNKILHEL